MIYRGTYYSKTLQISNLSDGLPVDISTWEFEATMRDGAGTELLEMSSSGGHFAVIDGTNGELRIALTEAQTEALSVGQVSFAVYRTDAAEGRQRVFKAEDIVADQD